MKHLFAPKHPLFFCLFLGIIIIAASLFLRIQAQPYLPGDESYYHLLVIDSIRNQGFGMFNNPDFIPQSFHLFLYPFIFFLGTLSGAYAFLILCSLLSVVCLYYV